MNVCSSALSEAALQVLFLASQANTAHPAPRPPTPPAPPARCHLSPAVTSLISQNLSPHSVCVRARLSAAAFARSSCCVPRADISVNQKTCSKLCTALFRLAALIIIVNV